ncbi:MAG TPA: hypothetical protein VKT70_14315, partial [Stellaceae bacterium]|nr:hypothetical protein [Stellaceae bacterium]
TGTALGGVGAMVVSSANAFSEQPLEGPAKTLYFSACGGPDQTDYHKGLIAEVKARMGGQVSEAEIEAAIAKLTCPICGCPLGSL